MESLLVLVDNVLISPTMGVLWQPLTCEHRRAIVRHEFGGCVSIFSPLCQCFQTDVLCVFGDAPAAPAWAARPAKLHRAWIVDFTAVLGEGSTWSFEGYVEYDEPTTLTIQFGGALQGHHTDVESSGYFSYTTDVSVDGPTLVTAQAIGDFEGIINSNVRGIWIS